MTSCRGSAVFLCNRPPTRSLLEPRCLAAGAGIACTHEALSIGTEAHGLGGSERLLFDQFVAVFLEHGADVLGQGFLNA